MRQDLEANKALLQRTYAEWWNSGDLGSVDELVADDYVDHSIQTVRSDKDALAQLIMEFRRGFPNMIETLEDTVAEGDLVVGRFRMRATHSGTFLGIPATGRVVEMTGIDTTVTGDGRIVEMWYNEDLHSLAQLGVEVPRAVG